MEHTYQFFNNKERIVSKQINKMGTYIGAQAWVFYKLCIIMTQHIQAMEKYLLN